MLSNGGGAHKLASLLGMYIVLESTVTSTAVRYRYIYVCLFITVAVCVICDNFQSMTVQNVIYIKYDFYPILWLNPVCEMLVHGCLQSSNTNKSIIILLI